MVLGVALAVVLGAALWNLLGDGFLRVAAVTAAILYLWSHVVAPLVFRPIGRALAHGARHEAEQAVAELVDPRLADLATKHETALAELGELRAMVHELLNRPA